MNIRRWIIEAQIKLDGKRVTQLHVNKDVKKVIKVAIEESMTLDEVNSIATIYQDIFGLEFKYKKIREVLSPKELKTAIDYGLAEYFNFNTVVSSYVKKDGNELYDYIKGKLIGEDITETFNNYARFVEDICMPTIVNKGDYLVSRKNRSETFKRDIGRISNLLLIRDGEDLVLGEMVKYYRGTESNRRFKRSLGIIMNIIETCYVDDTVKYYEIIDEIYRDWV